MGNCPVYRRQKLRADRRIQYIQQHILQFFVPTSIGIILHQMPYQRFRHSGIDPIHGHMIPIIGRPPKGQFGHIPGSDYQRILLIGNIHQNLRPFSRLPVFIRNIMAVHILPNILKMKGYRFFQIDFP